MKKAIIFFCLTVVLWALSVALTVRLVGVIKQQENSNLAVIEAPGSVIFPIEEAGTVSLWHNYKDVQNGKTVNNDVELPSGYRFELKKLGSITPETFVRSSMHTNFSSNNASKSGLGTFEVFSPGDYELTVTAPPGQIRVISLSKGAMMEGFGKILGFAGVAIVLGLLGVVTLVLGIVFVIAKPKSPPSIPSHAS